MIIKTIPQRTDKYLRIEVDILAETVIAKMGDVEDTFDFSTFGDGELDVESIETTLPVNPIIKATRTNGELYLELLHYYQDPYAPEEVRFPEPETYIEGVITIG